MHRSMSLVYRKSLLYDLRVILLYQLNKGKNSLLEQHRCTVEGANQLRSVDRTSVRALRQAEVVV